MRQSHLRIALLAALMVGFAARVAGAGDAGIAPAAPPDAPKGAAGADGTAAGSAAGTDPATEKRLAALRHKVLKDEDFVENEELNRDPFHPYLRLFADHEVSKTKKIPSAFDKAGLDELTLIAIVSGGDTPRAMFRDASGFGQAVKRGDFLSRSGARVTKILSDRVIVEITETTGTGEPRVVEKAILVNPDEAP
jgi:Tfp pilus assembly protein PilP